MPVQNYNNVELLKQTYTVTAIFRDSIPDFLRFQSSGLYTQMIYCHTQCYACLFNCNLAMVVDGAPCESDPPAGTDDLHT